MPPPTNLSASQLEAIQHAGGPLMIVAGPGSGKTTTLTLKMAYTLREGLVKPEEILAITFTQKAAKEIADRVQKLQSWGNEGPTMGTFHGLAYQMVKAHGDRLGLPPTWEILNNMEQQQLIAELLKKREGTLSLKPRDALLAVSRWKTMPSAATETSPEFLDFIAEYQTVLQSRGKLDFDDLLMHAVQLLRDHADLKAQHVNRFRMILVDEYQDTNALQAELIRHLAEGHRNLTVIGDPDQAIYAFRGANIENFIHFKKDYPEAIEIHLSENYRCPGVVVEASNHIITHNIRRLTKETLPVQKTDRRIELRICDTSWQEAKAVVETVQELVGGSDHLNVQGLKNGNGTCEFSWGDIAVLYRTSAVGEGIAKALDEAGIPFQRVGETTFFERKEIREFMDKIHAMHEGSEAITFPNEKLSQHLRRCLDQMGLKAKYDDGTPKGEHRYERLLELLNFSTLYDNLPRDEAFNAFYQYSLLARTEDQWDSRRDAVNLMTVHAAKGLEFPVVFMVGLEEGIFPYLKHIKDDNHIEEERRLFYVGVTRTKEQLYLSYAKERSLYGETVKAEPSRFVGEIPQDLFSITHREARKPRTIKVEEPSPQMELF